MHRNGFYGALAFVALGVILVSPAWAGDSSDLQEEVNQLRQQVEALSSQQQSLLEEEIEKYLDKNATWTAAQGKEKGLEGVSMTGRFTAISQNTVNLDSDDGGNRAIVAGDVDLDFWMQVTENLGLFIYTTANASRGTGDEDFAGAQIDDEFLSENGFDPWGSSPNLPATFATLTATASGVFDGIGVDGTRPIAPGSLRVREAGIQHSVPIGQNKMYWEVGKLDPRRRFLQTQFADDENTQFLNNLFDDPSSVSWLTNASGFNVFGVHAWFVFGQNEDWTINLGYFNLPGEFWNHGQLAVQLSWKGEIGGREMNARAFYQRDDFFKNYLGLVLPTNTSADNQWGFAWDWLATDQLGIFARIAGNTEDINPVEMDISVGVVYSGIGNRTNDSAGLAFGYQKLNDQVISAPKDSELVFELYYVFALEDGKLQITPSFMYIKDPLGQAAFASSNDLWILGLRIFVPF